jgi:hypothetical protein
MKNISINLDDSNISISSMETMLIEITFPSKYIDVLP